jgi:hypothetical protein
VLAGLHRPDRGERVPVVRRGDDHAVDVLVVEDAPQVLHVAGLEGRDVGELRIVDALVGEVGVDVADRLDLDVLQAREPALQRVALAADADAGEHHAVVRAEDAAAEDRRGAGRGRGRAEQIAADEGRGSHAADARGERAA